MNLRKTSLVTLALTGMYLFIAISFVSYFIVLQGHLQLEKQFLETDLQRAEKALDAEIDRIDMALRNRLQWEDFSFLGTDTLPVFPALEADYFILFFSSDGSLFLSDGINPLAGVEDPIPWKLTDFFHNDEMRAGVRGIISLPEELCLVALRPVPAETQRESLRGYLLMGRVLDENVERAVSRAAQLDVSILSLRKSREYIKSLVPEISSSYPFAARFTLEGKAEGFHLINDIHGNPVGALNLQMPRDIYNRGIITLNYLSISIGVIFLVLFIIFFQLLDKKILLRITHIADQVRVIGSLRDHSQRVVLSGDDELTGLASNINGMLSEFEEVSEELAENNATKDRFYSIIAHDLKGPFISLKSSASLIREALADGDGDEIEAVLTELDTVTNNAFNLLNNLLEWSRLQSGSIKVDPEAVAIRLIVEKNLFLVAEKLRSKQLSADNRVPAEVQVWVDYNMLDTVLRNLISNAVKFTPRGGQCTIETLERRKTVEIVIADTGIGIDPKHAKRMFKSDVGFSRPGTEGEKGTGFGLVLCKDFIKANGGSILVSSDLGVGSRFSIVLPKP